MEKNNDIDKIFTDALTDLHETAPKSVWESVSHELDKQQAALFREKYYRVKRLAVVLLLLIAIGSTGVFYHYTRVHHNSATALPATANRTDAPQPANQVSNPHTAATKYSAPANPNAAAYPGTVAEKSIQPGATEENSSNTTRTQTASAAGKNQPAPGNTPTENTIPNYNHPAENLLLTSSRNKITPTGALPVMPNRKLKLVKGNTVEGGAVGGQPEAGGTTATLTGTYVLHPAATLPAPLAMVSPTVARIIPSPIPTQKRLSLSDSAAAAVQAAQMVSRKRDLTGRFALEIFGTPNHSFTRLVDDRILARPGLDKEEAHRVEQQGGSYSFGLLADYALNRNWFVQSGVVYSSAHTRINGKMIYAKRDNAGHTAFEFNCSSGYAYVNPKTGNTPTVGDSIRVRGSSASVTYVGVPLSINYRISAGRFAIKPSAGISLNFLATEQSTIDFSGKGKTSSHIHGLKNSYLDASLGAGLEYRLSPRISIGARPLLRLALTSINQYTPVRAYQNYFSVETGLKVSL